MELLETGRYKARIKNAKWTQSEYRVSKWNPEGRCLSLILEVKTDETYRDVFASIDVGYLDKLNQVRAAIGLNEVKDKKEFKTDKFKNAHVLVDITQYTGKKSGKTTNIVTDFISKNEEQSEPEVDFSDEQASFSGDIPF